MQGFVITMSNVNMYVKISLRSMPDLLVNEQANSIGIVAS